MRIGIAQGAPLENLDETVAKRFPQAIDRLEQAGCRLSNEKLALLDGMARVNARGGVQPAEAFTLHRDRLDRRGADIDPNVRVRLERARSIGAADYIEMVNERAALIAAMDARLADIDVLALPTTPIVAPTIAEMTAPDVFARKNAMLLRNTSIANFFDLLRHLAAAAARGRPADRTDAGRAQRPRPASVPHRGGHRAVVGGLSGHYAVDEDCCLRQQCARVGRPFVGGTAANDRWRGGCLPPPGRDFRAC